MQCRDEVDFERWQVDLLAWMLERADGLDDNRIWITSLIHRSLEPCGSCIVRNIGPTIVTLKCGCVLIVDRARYLLGCITLKCSRFALAMAQKMYLLVPQLLVG